jgi:hypothetical protein
MMPNEHSSDNTELDTNDAGEAAASKRNCDCLKCAIWNTVDSWHRANGYCATSGEPIYKVATICDASAAFLGETIASIERDSPADAMLALTRICEGIKIEISHYREKLDDARLRLCLKFVEEHGSDMAAKAQLPGSEAARSVYVGASVSATLIAGFIRGVIASG